MKRFLAAALCAPLLAACATPTLDAPMASRAEIAREAALQRAYVVERRRDQEIILHRVMFRLSTAAVDVCQDKIAGAIGMSTLSARSLPSEYQDIARTDFGLDDSFTITAVVENSPADIAGLQPGDKIQSIDGTEVSGSRRDTDRLQTALRRRAAAQQSLEMVVRRNGHNLPVSITPIQACYYQSSIVQSDEVNAYADGDQVYVTNAMMNFVRSEEELALVLSHEISHNALDHLEKKQQNRVVGALVGAVVDIAIAAAGGNSNGDFTRAGAAVGGRAYSVEFEQEADYQGLYLMRRAGYELDMALEYWRRIAAENPEQITLRSTHPTSAERFVSLSRTVDEIILKEMQGLALLPNAQQGRSTQYARAPLPLPTQRSVLAANPQRNVSSLSPRSPSRNAPQAVAVEKPNLRVRGGTVVRGESGPSSYLSDPYGAWIDDAESDGPAARAGIRRADIIRTFNGHRVETFEELETYAAETVPGSRVRLGVFRNREMITIEVDF